MHGVVLQNRVFRVSDPYSCVQSPPAAAAMFHVKRFSPAPRYMAPSGTPSNAEPGIDCWLMFQERVRRGRVPA
jgi:hypothetical protein